MAVPVRVCVHTNEVAVGQDGIQCCVSMSDRLTLHVLGESRSGGERADVKIVAVT